MAIKYPQPFNLASGFELAPLQQRPDITVNSPATDILLDFRIHPALTIPSKTQPQEAQDLLANSRSSLLLVVDHSGHFCGVVTEHSLSEQAIMQQASLGRRRTDLQVKDLMVPRNLILAVDYSEFCRSTAGKLVAMLKNEGVPYMVVVNSGSQEIIGVIAAAALAKLFNMDLTIAHQPSFIDIFDAVMH
ncbi:MAG: CBS domain-containing protein [Porticoccaceae bacterium]|nr:CBS domain-containing protein [Porticoccaceae bacterium]